MKTPKILKSKKAVMSTQRLLLMIVAMNLLIGLIAEFYMDDTASPEDILEIETTYGETTRQDMEDASGYTRTKSSTTITTGDNTIGNTQKQGIEILGILWRALEPFPFEDSQFNDPVEQRIAEVIKYFRYLMYILAIVEVYMFFKNKKTT